MAKKSRYKPALFVDPPETFGFAAEPTWRLPAPGRLDYLRASIYQHHYARALRAALEKKDLSQRQYCERHVGGRYDRLNRVLKGDALMQGYDLGNAAKLGPRALPHPQDVVGSVELAMATLQRPPTPHTPKPVLGPSSTFDPGRPTFIPVPTMLREPTPTAGVQAERRVLGDEVRALLEDWLAAGHWPTAAGVRVRVDARVEGYYTVGGYALLTGKGALNVLVVVPEGWSAALARDLQSPELALPLDLFPRASDQFPPGLRLAVDLGVEFLTARRP